MSKEKLDSIREEQMKTKKVPGIYGNYSLWRHKTPAEYAEQFKNNPDCVLRFRSHGDTKKRISFEDINRGRVTMIDNYNDSVLLKS